MKPSSDPPGRGNEVTSFLQFPLNLLQPIELAFQSPVSEWVSQAQE